MEPTLSERIRRWNETPEEAMLADAAPDLLAALETALGMIRFLQPADLGEGADAHEFRADRAKIIAAIAKAKGQ